MNKFETLYELVQAEADNLRKHATPAEKSRLNFRTFNPRKTRGCIYGQMTGNCYENRAAELIIKCAAKVYLSSAFGIDANQIYNLNGKPFKINTYRQFEYHSPIELYVYLNDLANTPEFNENLLEYIKGDADVIEINPLLVSEEYFPSFQR